VLRRPLLRLRVPRRHRWRPALSAAEAGEARHGAVEAGVSGRLGTRLTAGGIWVKLKGCFAKPRHLLDLGR
jgi:hypothetical protein